MSRASSTQLADIQGHVDLHSWNLDICNLSRQDQVQLTQLILHQDLPVVGAAAADTAAAQ